MQYVFPPDVVTKGRLVKMKNKFRFKATVIAIGVTLLVLGVLGIRRASTNNPAKKPLKGVSAHTVIYQVRKYQDGKLKSERIVSRSVNERGEWYEETLFPKSGKGVALLEDGHYLVDKETGEKLQVESGTSRTDCSDRAEKIRDVAKDTIEIAGLTAYVVGGKTDEASGLSYERAYARETGCTPLRVDVKARKGGSEITYEALKVIFAVNSRFGREWPVTKDIRKE